MSLTCDTCGRLLRPPARVWTRGAGAILWCDHCRGFEGGADDGWRELDEAEVVRRARELELAELSTEPAGRVLLGSLTINRDMRNGMAKMGLQTGYNSAEQTMAQTLRRKPRSRDRSAGPTPRERAASRWLAMTPEERERAALAEQRRLRGEPEPSAESADKSMKQEDKPMGSSWTTERREKFSATMAAKRQAKQARRADPVEPAQRAAVERIAPKSVAGTVEGLVETLRRLETIGDLSADGRALLLWGLRLPDDDRAALADYVEGVDRCEG